jgi:hypothetical protein
MGYLFILPSFAQQSGKMSECEQEYRERAKAKRDKLNRQIERHMLGTWINLNGQYVRLEDQGGNPNDYYNNYEEDILQIHAQSRLLSSGAQEITHYVQKKIKADAEDLKRAIHFGFVTGDLCKKTFGVKNRKQTARYIMKHLQELQSISHSTSNKINDSLESKEHEVGTNIGDKAQTVSDK